MNFFNDRELARRFKTGNVPSKERLIYLLISSMIVAGVPFYISPSVTQAEKAADLLTLLFTLFGTIGLYFTNRKGDDKEFVERYICLGFPVMVQSLFVGIVATMIIVLGSGYIYDFTTTQAETVGLLAYTVVSFGYFFLRLNSSIKIVASA